MTSHATGPGPHANAGSTLNPVYAWLGLPVGIITGLASGWWLGKLAARASRPPGPRAPRADAGAPDGGVGSRTRVGEVPGRASGGGPRREPADLPQGLVPLALRLTNSASRLWFVPRYLPEPWPIPAIVAFVLAGLAAYVLAWRWWRAANRVARNGAAQEIVARRNPRRQVRRSSRPDLDDPQPPETLPSHVGNAPQVQPVSRAPDRRSSPPEVLVEMARLKALSDGVVAVALTLMVFDIRLPAGVTPAVLGDSLLALGPELLIYLLSFAIIGSAWGSHQRMLGQIGRGDGLLVWFTLLSLLPITLVPACASLLGEFPSQFIAIAVFATDALAIQLTAFWLWRHAGRRSLIDPSLDRRVVDGIGRRHVVSALGFALSIPLALAAPALAYALWVAVFALVFTTDWVSWRQAIRSTTEAIALDGATEARVRVRHVAGILNVDAIESDSVLLDGVFGGGVERMVSHEGGRADIQLVLPRVGGLLDPRYPWAWGRFSPVWDLGLNADVPVSLSVETKGGTADLDLGDVRLTDLDVRADGSVVEVSLPAGAGHVTVAVLSKASAVTIRVPDGVAAWLHGERDTPELDVDLARFPVAEPGRGHRSADYDTAHNRVDLTAVSAAGSIRIVARGRGPATPEVSASGSPTSRAIRSPRRACPTAISPCHAHDRSSTQASKGGRSRGWKATCSTKGVHYDTGTTVFRGPGYAISTRRAALDLSVVRRELEIIRDDLHANAVRIVGSDVRTADGGGRDRARARARGVVLAGLIRVLARGDHGPAGRRGRGGGTAGGCPSAARQTFHRFHLQAAALDHWGLT